MNAEDWSELLVQMQTAYDSIALKFAEGASRRQKTDRLDEFLEYLPDCEGTIADFGCGAGHDTAYFVSKGHSAIGIDISRTMIDIARSTFPGITFVTGDITEFGFKEIIGAWANSSIQHIPKSRIEPFLNCVYERMVPHGVFYANFRSGYGEGLEVSEEYGTAITRFFAKYTEQEFNAVLKNCGFAVIRSQTYTPCFDGPKRLQVPAKTIRSEEHTSELQSPILIARMPSSA